MFRWSSIGVALLAASAVSLATVLTLPESSKRPVGEYLDRVPPVRRHVSRVDPQRDAQPTRAPQCESWKPAGSQRLERVRAPEFPGTRSDVVAKVGSPLRSQPMCGNVASTMWSTMVRLAVGESELLALFDDECRTQANDLLGGVRFLAQAARVARVGARGVVAEPSFYDNGFEARFPVAIEFAASTDTSNAAITPTNEFSSATRKIFATFASGSVRGRKVLVKWTDLDRKRVYVYGKYAVDPHAGHNFVWVETEDDWIPGPYAVEIYSMAGGLTPIAGGRYVIR
jgi:hypothetical protein